MKRRKGLMKLALRHGVPLVPCYCFGETDTYHQSAFALPLRQWICSKFGIAVTLAYGRNPLLPFLPIPTKLVIICGNPIKVGAPVAEPSPEAVDELHAKYVAGLQEVFDARKAEHGYPDATLMIV